MNKKNRAIRWGVVAWMLICVAAVWMRGVQWDETFEHAQVITGQVPYPDGHPLVRYCQTAYSVQTTLSVLMLKAGLGPMAVCGFRNVVVLVSSVLPAFLLGALLTRRALWGHVAAVLTMAGVYLEFDGSYPLMVWPSLYSNGHIGGGVALIVLFLIVAGHVRAGFLMAGLMPAIHAGQAAPVLGIAALMLAWLWWRKERKAAVQAVVFGAVGAGLTALFFIIASSNALPPPTSGPYYSTIDAHAVWSGYTWLHDLHRRFPPMNGQIMLIGTLILASVAAWRERDPLRPRAWLLMYIAGIAAAVWTLMAIHAHMGPSMPFALIGWMPYRLINHVPPILLAIIIVTLVNHRAAIVFVPVLAFLILEPLYPHAFGPDFTRRYLADGQLIMFALYGISLGFLLISNCPKLFWAVFALPIILAPFHQFGAAWLAVGLISAYIIHRFPAPRVPRYALVSLMILEGVSLLAPQWYKRRDLPVDAFSRQVSNYLVAKGEPNALLVYPPDAFLPQAKTGHPILAENSTPSLISYAPNIAPSIEKIYNDIYGISFMLKTVPITNDWQQVWTARTRTQWQALANEYNFHHIVAPSDIPLDLTPILTDRANTLYSIVEAESVRPIRTSDFGSISEVIDPRGP